MQGKRILVAGGSGLVGANLTKRLVLEGADVIASYCSKRPNDYLEKYRQLDFTRFEDCLEATKNKDCVFLCAAKIFGVKKMQEQPTAFILPNLQINAGLLEACSRNGVQRVVLISSSTVYQETFHPVLEEELNLNAPPYPLYFGVGWLNRYLEQLAAFYRQKCGLEIVIVRPTNIYGAFDSFEDGKAHVVPSLIKRALNKEDPFILWGNGNEVRNFLFVDDLIDDLLVLARLRCQETFNLCGQTNLTVSEAAQIILSSSNHDVPLRFDTSKPSAIPYRALACAKADALLGRRPRTSFEEGVKKTIEWYKSTLN